MNRTDKKPKLDDQFLHDALDPSLRVKMIRGARIRRNICIFFFIASFISIFICGFSRHWISTVIPLFFSTLSLVVMTKYDTQLVFLRIMQHQQKTAGSEEPAAG